MKMQSIWHASILNTYKKYLRLFRLKKMEHYRRNRKGDVAIFYVLIIFRYPLTDVLDEPKCIR